jgi:hypothetical protein
MASRLIDDQASRARTRTRARMAPLIMIIFIFSKFSKLERNVVKMFTPGTTRAHARGRTDWRSLGGRAVGRGQPSHRENQTRPRRRKVERRDHR